MTIVEQFSAYIKEDFFYTAKNEKALHLVEEKGTPYEVVIKVDRETSTFLVIHNLEALKNDFAHYLKQAPKDCDYVILDLIEEVVYVIELKDTATTNSSLMKQLEAGENWLNHLLFCCRIEDFTKGWPVKRLGIRYDAARPTKARRPRRVDSDDHLQIPLQYIKDVAGKDLFLFRGREFRLGSIEYV